MSVDEITAEARKLPVDQFVELVSELIKDLPSDQAEQEIELEWARDSEQRLRELLSGKAKGIPRDQVDASLNA